MRSYVRAVSLSLSFALTACGGATTTHAATHGAVLPGDEAHALRVEIGRALDAWHAAAARADEQAYFAAMTDDAVFLGTDATERWDATAFRAYAHPHFVRGKAWAFRAVRRDITIGPGGDVAWFDEDLETSSLGAARGSGVVVRTAGGFKIAHYDLSVPIPNERFADVKRVIAGEPAPR